MRSGRVVPEVRAAMARAIDRLEMEELLNDADTDTTLADKGKFGSSCDHFAWHWFHRFPKIMDTLPPEAASQLRTGFLCFMEKRVRALELYNDEKVGRRL